MQLVTPLLHIASSSIVDCCIRTPTGIAMFVDEIVFKFYVTVLRKKMCTPGCHRLFWNPGAHAGALQLKQINELRFR